jgi:hypothetical protein
MGDVKTVIWTQQSRQSELGLEFLLVKALLFVLLVAAQFCYPDYPSLGLDPSWRMALGQVFHDGLQFGPDVTFTFGPLGFLFGNTYIGVQFWSLIVWQLLAAAVFAIIILDGARLLTGLRRIIYFGFFLFVDSLLATVDVLPVIIIAMIGFELIRRSSEDWRPTTSLLVLCLALLANIKFTYLILASSAVLILCGQELFRGRWPIAMRLAACFFAGFLGWWIACGQSLYNLPIYLYNSWHISQGYSQTMGVTTPAQPFWLGMAVLVMLSAYGLLYLILHFDRSCTLSRFILLTAFIYLTWKHGFVRSDGHMLVFFFSVLFLIVAFPALLDDLSRRRWHTQVLLALAGLFCIWGIHSTGMHIGWPGVIWQAPSRLVGTFWRHYHVLGQWTAFRASYAQQLAKEKQRFDLPRTRAVIGQAPIDVLGYEQAIALYNGFTYRPRPVFQSYSAYTPYLARLNDAFYRSSRAPEYALLKLQSIDNRFPTLDDSLLWRSFMHRYNYVHTELGFQLWQRRSQPLQAGPELAGSLRSATVKLNQPLELGALAHKRLWATLQLTPSWLGHLRNAVYKPPIVNLTIQDTQGKRSTFRLPLTQAATGFILNPPIEDSVDYLCFAMGVANRQIDALTLEVPQQDQKFFHETAYVELSELPSALSGNDCRAQRDLYMTVHFRMFQSLPINFETPIAPSEIQLDGRPAVMMHAPSKMEFAVPEGATTVSGAFGFAPGAYTGSGKTDGATFRILWQDSQHQVELYQHRLDPLNVPGDRGLQDFYVDLKGLAGGKLLLQVDPGANAAWDWTAWTAIKID